VRRLFGATGRGLIVAAGVASLCLTAGEAAAWEQRKNTVSFGFEGGLSSMESTGAYEREGSPTGPVRYPMENYRLGPSLGVRLRYSLDRSHAVGVSFEDLRFRRKSGVGRSSPREFQTNNFLLDYYVYLSREDRLTPYLVLGAGLHRTTFRVAKDDNLIPPMGLAANFGGGLEYFVRPPFAIQAAVRGYYLSLRGSGEWSYDGPGMLVANVQLGFQYYLLK